MEIPNGLNRPLKLTVELIPTTAFYSNLRKYFTKGEWDTLRKHVYKKAGYCCEICGKRNVTLSAHEKWMFGYNADTGEPLQYLEDILSLCNDCHMIKHLGFAEILASEGKLDLDELIQHFLDVNEASYEEYLIHNEYMNKVWEAQSRIKWKLEVRDYADELPFKLDGFERIYELSN